MNKTEEIISEVQKKNKEYEERRKREDALMWERYNAEKKREKQKDVKI